MVLNYRRHFAGLLLAVCVLSFASLSDALDPFVTYWVLVGVLVLPIAE